MGDLREPAPAHAPEGAVRGASSDGAVAEHGFEVAANPATIGVLLATADGATRERLVVGLQRRHGNAAVQRLLAAAGPSLPVQRWAVTLPAGTADCGVVVNWMNAHSPYRNDSGWARTNARFSWSGDPAFASDGSSTATVSNPHVTKTVNVDMPSWSPSDATMRAAWTSMTTDLRAHEGRHEAIADTWETNLTTNLTNLSVSVRRRTLDAFNTAVQAQWDGWLRDHQRDQRAIDPYSALLDCSGGTGGAGSSGGSGGGGGGGTADLTGLEEEADLGGF
jgi:hypothetical protein